MSNVIIGIIGVVLFIGLALAGALYLGDQFKASQNTSMAAGTIQQLKQVIDARDLYRLQEGKPYAFLGQVTPLVTAGYLKSISESVVPGGSEPIMTGTMASPEYVMIYFPFDRVGVCEAINKQLRGNTTIQSMDDFTGQRGCYRDDFGGEFTAVMG